MIARQYVSNKDWGRKLTSIEDNMNASKEGIEDYIKKNNNNREKNNFKDISSNKLAKSYTKRAIHCYERKTLRETLDLF